MGEGGHSLTYGRGAGACCGGGGGEKSRFYYPFISVEQKFISITFYARWVTGRVL